MVVCEGNGNVLLHPEQLAQRRELLVGADGEHQVGALIAEEAAERADEGVCVADKLRAAASKQGGLGEWSEERES